MSAQGHGSCHTRGTLQSRQAKPLGSDTHRCHIPTATLPWFILSPCPEVLVRVLIEDLRPVLIDGAFREQFLIVLINFRIPVSL